MSRTSANIYEKLPEKLFSPLASPNRHHYWALLCNLHDRRFGPDAPLPPSRGYPVKLIQQDLQECMELMDAWADEEDCISTTPADIRAILVFNRLRECGWLQVDNPRFEKKVTMQPAVAQFMTMLVSFSETGPIFVGGKINSILASLKMALDPNNSQPASWVEAAEQTRHLMEHVRNTGTNIQEFMERLDQKRETGEYVHTFFEGFIVRTFIGDYRELRTTEHPLSKRGQILDMLDEVRESAEMRDRLISWYGRVCNNDKERAEGMLHRDMSRLAELRRMDEYLLRLDEEVTRATKRALTYFEYRTRNSQPVEQMVNHAITSLQDGRVDLGFDLFASGDPLTETMLAQPRKAVERAAPTSLRKTTVSPEKQAMSRLMRLARERRSVTHMKMMTFAGAQLGDDTQMDSAKLKLESIEELRLYQAFSAIAMRSGMQGLKIRSEARAMVPGYIVLQTGTEEEENDYMTARLFTIERRQKGRT
jgi:hypothetical protein